MALIVWHGLLVESRMQSDVDPRSYARMSFELGRYEATTAWALTKGMWPSNDGELDASGHGGE